MRIFREITPIDSSDVFVILDSLNKGFDYPIHYHAEYELTLVLNSAGNRIVGDSNEKYRGKDLVLLGPYLFHKWDDEDMPGGAGFDCRVITVQFDMHLFENQILVKRPFHEIRHLLERSRKGIQFTGRTLELAEGILREMTRKKGLQNVLLFLQLLDILSRSDESRCLSSEGFAWEGIQTNSTRLHAAYQFIIENFKNPDFKMSNVASHVNLSDSAFSHFFRKSTNKSFTRFLVEMRLGYACRLLQETDELIRDIGRESGFNNIANFNRLFRKMHGCTPFEYRRLIQEKAQFDWYEQTAPGQFVPDDQLLPSDYKPDSYAATLLHT